MEKKFITNVSENFKLIKQQNSIVSAWKMAIPLQNNQGFLLPICKAHIAEPQICEKLTRWRNTAMLAFQTQFIATPQRTHVWLKKLINESPTRVLFLITDEKKTEVGHVGLTNPNKTYLIELDNVLRGELNMSPGIMANAVTSLISWVKTITLTKEVFLRVFEDNMRAVNFYHQLGFKTCLREPLKKIESKESITYLPATDDVCDKIYLHMFLS
ncbi:MAG: aminotransferase [uncultured bacterium]|nr:MAG: aminotransferase [uncultured bacterium]OGT25458.1 MAG: hypothetical protein A3B71_05285 [Gammaproteobacteria bacterium RIFCSPHIGHO2_02_FULL_42_43]OGT27525.1 MAG: hypothetical protein A2624_03735 [Gammaproteobacteria bacterium RIFCSPHIGHO2_01_FULL_42_8]OGT51409.1 MAG: hypothetical protein A3E54_05050 [Gammaproteobacteria bacterium RIFCSPHIGHO2_12_FULL_41_25]OGT62111.1 MAG: hypothetical protein A3I77_03980 [Gammaproteobacteria bacterium RIFCSPLOWO2_02_FULL_42_14]OGT85783.1 MAG: hypotheti